MNLLTILNKPGNHSRRQNLKANSFFSLLFILLFTFAGSHLLVGAENFLAQQKKPGPKISREKTFVLDWLGRETQIEFFGRISDRIWSYAELGLQEYKSSDLLAETLEKAGFKVERGLAGLPTCFVATFGEGKPVIGFLGEFDALPGLSQKGRVPKQDPLIEGAPGHGCGHNTMGTAAVAAAIATKEAMVKFGLKGTIKVFGSPAEEILASRPYMVRAGLFQGVDAVIDNHSSSDFSTAYGVSGNAVISTIFTFKGKTAHSAGAPWAGRSALDAVELLNIAVNYLREHLNPAHRVHYVILEGGGAPNVVPEKASVWYYVRNTDDQLEQMFERVVNCAKAAALATGTELAEVRVLSATHQFHGNKALAELIQKNIELVGMPAWDDEEENFALALQAELKTEEKGLKKEVSKLREPREGFTGGGSTDVGEVTLVAPTATLRFPSSVPGAIGHHWSNVASVYGSIAWKGLNAGAKAMALTAVDLLNRPEELKKIQVEFEQYLKRHPYKSFLPAEAQPPLDLNKPLMDKWRSLLEEYELKD
ncbi:MAG: amidohydrolase [Acidobacteriota bacterium]|nr:amidohydrolase [Acidobacteriota bacterium]MDW3228927.1 amidohydrolase [Acidobacteriota bacterium]MDY0230975.1 amidohydrolase [Candidatus Saccharicenans sp.]